MKAFPKGPSIALAATLAACLAVPAWAHDPKNPQLDDWYNRLARPGQWGGTCCNLHDCKPVQDGQDDRSDAWIDQKRGVWRLRITKKVFGPLAQGQVLDAPPKVYARTYPDGKVATNLAGQAVVCWNPWVGLLCFVPPAEY